MMLHVYGQAAYRSELSLFKREGVTAREAVSVEVPDGTRDLWRVSGAGGQAFETCGLRAWQAFDAARQRQADGASLTLLPVA